MHRPSKAELLAAREKTIPDVIAPGLRVLFCGINPGLYSAAIGHHFGRPGNRFWPTLHAAGFTPRLFAPVEDSELLKLGLGITNLVPRATAAADELTAAELRAGGERLQRKARRYRPDWVAVVGVGAFRTAFAEPRATLGPQERQMHSASVWVLPNPSGLNAHYQADRLIALFRDLRRALDA